MRSNTSSAAIFALLISILTPARAENLSLPENFFRSSGIRSRQFVLMVDLCPRVKEGRKVLLISQWEGANVLPEATPSRSTASKTSKKSKRKGKRSRKSKLSPQAKSQMEIESVISQLLAEKEIDTLAVESCSFGLAKKFGTKAAVLCEPTPSKDRYAALIEAIKKSTTTKPILAVYEEQYSEEFMKRFTEEKWNCEIYEPKAFKTKKVKRKVREKEEIIEVEEDEHED